MSLEHFEERADSWRLLIEGWKVSQYSSEPELAIEIVPANDSDQQGHFEVAGGVIAGLGTRDLIGRRVQEVTIWKDGRLAISFQDGASLLALPEPEVEAWQIVGPEGLLVVCPTGGGEPHIWFGGGDDPEYELDDPSYELPT